MFVCRNRNAFISYYFLFWKRSRNKCFIQFTLDNKISSHNSSQRFALVSDSKRIRNVGVMAHVDAGKTTTTERMLFYAGFSQQMGDVDDGTTVTDYMQQERERGITIMSAAVSFAWKNHQINLVDTPGHVDFTMEVQRCLRVLDGAVTILDASAGVEAQTLTVWRQADQYQVPRIIYINKMDKKNANVDLCKHSIEKKLKANPLFIQLPVFKSSCFIGVIDLLNMELIEWNLSESSLGQNFRRIQLTETNSFWNEAMKARRNLVESLAEFDNTIMELVLQSESFDNITSTALETAVRAATLKHLGIPVLYGSSYKNIGVQLLLDAIVSYLPCPTDIQMENALYYKGSMCALAFKVINDKQKGFLTFLRLYSGNIEQNQKLFNVNKEYSEKITKVYIAYANVFKEVPSVSAGNIAVVTGLKSTISGDTLVASSSVANTAKALYYKQTKQESFPLLEGVQVPEPVFFCCVEPASLDHQKKLEFALECLQREDPSLKVSFDSDTGQTVLSGMGELHLDIVRNRIQREYKVDADVSALQVSYRETVQESATETVTINRTIGNTRNHVTVTISVEPDIHSSHKLRLIHTRENQENLAHIWQSHLQAIENGIALALNHGTILGFPMTNVQAYLHWFEAHPKTSHAVISAAASEALGAAFKAANPCLMEPIMYLEIITDTEALNRILGDLAHRRGQVMDITVRQDLKVICALVPLAELIGYSTVIRTLSSGSASVSMKFDSYQKMSSHDQKKAVEVVTGFS